MLWPCTRACLRALGFGTVLASGFRSSWLTIARFKGGMQEGLLGHSTLFSHSLMGASLYIRGVCSGTYLSSCGAAKVELFIPNKNWLNDRRKVKKLGGHRDRTVPNHSQFLEASSARTVRCWDQLSKGLVQLIMLPWHFTAFVLGDSAISTLQGLCSVVLSVSVLALLSCIPPFEACRLFRAPLLTSGYILRDGKGKKCGIIA